MIYCFNKNACCLGFCFSFLINVTLIRQPSRVKNEAAKGLNSIFLTLILRFHLTVNVLFQIYEKINVILTLNILSLLSVILLQFRLLYKDS